MGLLNIGKNLSHQRFIKILRTYHFLKRKYLSWLKKKKVTWHSKMTCLILIGPPLLNHTGVSFRPTLRIEETEIGSPSFLSFYSSSQQQRNKQIRSDRFFSQQVCFSFLISHQSKTPISFYIYMSLYHVIYIYICFSGFYQIDQLYETHVSMLEI